MGLKHTDLSMRLRDGRAGAKATDHRHEVPGPIGGNVSRIVMQGDPNLCLRGREMKVGGHDTRDLSAHAFELNGTANDGGIFAETLLPQGMAQDDVVVLASAVFTRVECSA